MVAQHAVDLLPGGILAPNREGGGGRGDIRRRAPGCAGRRYK